MEFLYPCKHAEILRKFLKRLLFLEHLLFPNIEILLNLELLQFQERHQAKGKCFILKPTVHTFLYVKYSRASKSKLTEILRAYINNLLVISLKDLIGHYQLLRYLSKLEGIKILFFNNPQQKKDKKTVANTTTYLCVKLSCQFETESSLFMW